MGDSWSIGDGFTREPWEWGPTVAQELREQTAGLRGVGLYAPPAPAYGRALCPCGCGTSIPGLTEADVRRIVREEMEAARPVPSVLDVTPEDVRVWLPGGRCA